VSQSPLPDAALAVLENAINHYIALDPEAAGRLAPLEGYIIAFEFKGFGSRLYFIPGPEGFQIYGAYDADPDCLLRGTPLALARLGMSGRKEDALFSGQVEIEGDAALAQRFGDFMAGLEIDWEEQLSRLTGDSRRPRRRHPAARRGPLGSRLPGHPGPGSQGIPPGRGPPAAHPLRVRSIPRRCGPVAG
jgi:ubiquinone biosynthesis protein UbiJ